VDDSPTVSAVVTAEEAIHVPVEIHAV